MGKVYLVGAGPGDPDLITVKGMKTIEAADVILYDRLVNKELLTYAPEHCKLIYCGKRPDNHFLTQDKINDLLTKYALQGKIVVRLKGGDPFIFGRGGEEAEALRQNNIPYEIVPGITAGAAAPAYAGIPLTHRDYSSSVAFVSGVNNRDVNDEQYWKNIANGADTICIYMGVKSLPHICEKLIQHGRPASTPAAVIYCGTTAVQETVVSTLRDISGEAKHLKNPSMIVIGEVVRLRAELQWFEALSYHQPWNESANIS